MSEKPAWHDVFRIALFTGLGMIIFFAVFDFCWTLFWFGPEGHGYHGLVLELLLGYGLTVVPPLLAGAAGACLLHRVPGVAWMMRRLPFHGVPALIMAGYLFLLFIFFSFRDWLPEDFRVASARGAALALGIVLGSLALGLGLSFVIDLIYRRRPVVCRFAYWIATTFTLVFGLAMALQGPDHLSDPRPASDNASGPNLVVIVLDTLRADHVSAYDPERSQTPHIDALAADGILFENAYTPTPWTRPAMASLWTGLHPPTHKLRKGRKMGDGGRPDRLSTRAMTLAELLQDAGYGTYGFNTNIMIGPEFQLDQGFHIYRTFRPPVFGKTILCDWLGAGFHGQFTDLSYEDGGDLTDYVLEWLEQKSPPDPYFLYVHYMDPHEPYWDDPGAMWSEHTKHWDESQNEWSRANYRKEVEYVDRQVGRLIDELKDSGIYDESLVIVVSDHGEEFFEHGRNGHGDHIIEQQIGVPFIVKLPGNTRAGERIGTPVSLTDFPPTVLAALGIDVPDAMQGRNILAPLEENRSIFSETGYELEGMQGVTTRQWRFIERLGPADPVSTLPDVALFNQRTDPDNTRNILEQHPDVAATLSEQIDQYKREALDQALPEESTELSDEAMDQMRKLGYTGG